MTMQTKNIKEMSLLETIQHHEYSVAEMRAAREALTAKIDAAQQKERQKLREATLAGAQALGIDIKDLFAEFLGERKDSTKKESGTEARVKPAIKYRNPNNLLEVSTGRGLKPAWMVREIEAAAEKGITLTKADFLIKA